MLLGVGAQKAGTSWLFDHLSRDPDILASPIKEMHFFDAWLGAPRLAGFDGQYLDLAARMRRPLARLRAPRMSRAVSERAEMARNRGAYLDFFARRLSGQRFLLEVTPGYALLDAAAWRRARRFLEEAGLDVRPVYLMRDPVERHYSALRMEQATGRRGDARASFRASLRRKGVLAHGRYDQRLGDLWSAFREDHVVVGFYEDVFAGPERHLRALTDRLGLVWRAPDFARRVNASPEAGALPPEDVAAGIEAYRPVYDFVNVRFGSAKPASWNA